MKEKELEIALNHDNIMTFSDFINARIAYETVYQEKDKEIERLNNKLKDIKSQLDYLETYSSKEDVFEDMKRRLDRIDKIIGSDKE